jgi:hypothetical protein
MPPGGDPHRATGECLRLLLCTAPQMGYCRGPLR